MTPLRRDVACAVCRLVACVCTHLTALGQASSHAHHSDARSKVVAEALPPEPSQTHDDFDRSVRIQLNDVTASGTSTEAPPFVSTVDSSDVVRRLCERRSQHHPAYYGASASWVMPPLPLRTPSDRHVDSLGEGAGDDPADHRAAALRAGTTGV